MTDHTQETAVCRGCGMELDGKPYYMGGGAKIPGTRERARVCHYGGYVCSRSCDINASLDLEQSMPGHGASQQSVGREVMQGINERWEEE